MGMPVTKPTKFSGIQIQYDPSQDPYFELNITQSLDILGKSGTMQKIFKRIADANPGDRPGGGFPANCNVLITPPLSRKYVGAPGKMQPSMQAKCQAEPQGLKRCSEMIGAQRSIGSPAYLRFTNREFRTKDGESLRMETTLAHELIHCMHYLYGEARPDKTEEYYTTGLYMYAGEELTENRVRDDLNYARRTKYYGADTDKAAAFSADS